MWTMLAEGRIGYGVTKPQWVKNKEILSREIATTEH